MAGVVTTRLLEALKGIGVDVSQQQASNVKKLAPKNKSSATKPGLLASERDTGGNFGTVLDIFKNEAKYIDGMNDAEQMAFLNNIMDYNEFGGKSINKTSEGISGLQTDLDKITSTAKNMKDDAEKGLASAEKDLKDFLDTGGQPLKAKSDKYLGGSMHEEGQLRTAIRTFLRNEYKNGRIKLDKDDQFRIMEYSPMMEDDPIKVFKKIYGDEAYNKAGTFPGAFEKGENFNHYEAIFKENMGEDILKVKDKKYVGDGKLILTKQEEVFEPTPDVDDDGTPFAKGGRASFVGGKIVDELVAMIIKKEPMDAMKEVNKIIGKKGKYKNLTQKDIDRIVDQTNDHIFQRDPDNLYVGDRNVDDMSVEDSLTTLEGLGATKMAERFKLKQKYPGIDDDLLTNIIEDTDPVHKASVLAKIDMAMELGKSGKQPEEIIDILKKETDTKMATGGRAGYYGGGQAMVEPDLSDIGHGSDSLMARTRITAPGSQATTSTGLNYLLGEDNDNTRVPFKDGLTAEKNPTEIFQEKVLEKITSSQPEKKDEQAEMFKTVKEFQKFKENNPESRMSFFMFRNKKKIEKELFKNKIIELDLKYPDKKIINEQGFVDKENLKSAIDEAEADLEISPIDGLSLKRSVNTEGEQSSTSGSFNIGNFNFSSPNLEEGQLTSGADFKFGNLDLSGMVDSKDSNILNTKFGFNYDNTLEGKMTNSDGYRSTELDLNKSFPISDNINFDLKGSADTTTIDGKTYRNSDLTPKLSYNDGILNASIAKEIMEGGETPNLSAGINFNDFYLKGGNLLSEKDRSGVIGYQKEIGDPDGSAFFTLGGEKDLFDDNYTVGAGFKYKFAEGGIAGLRPGYAGGTLVDKGRRGFLKFLGGTAAGVVALKTGLAKILGKDSGAISKKALDEVIIEGGSGAPAWLQPLVNKALRDGKDISKNAIKDGQVVKSLDTPTGKVDVYYDTRTGEVDVDYIGGNTALGESVQMRYTPGIADEGTKGVKPQMSLKQLKAIPEGRGYSYGDDYDYSIDMGENTVGDVKGLYSDTSELAELGGQKILTKDIVETVKKKKILKQMEDNPADFITDVQGDYVPD
jgi:hypothetical protein